MASHYLFDADFCLRCQRLGEGRGRDREVQDNRRRIWIDAHSRKWGSFEELNVWLATRCQALWSEIRHPEYKQLCVAEMLEQERAELMPMPSAFDGYVERSAKVSSTCLVVVAKNRYSVPCELAGFGQQLIFWDHAITLLNQAQQQIKGPGSECDRRSAGVNQTLVREDFKVSNLEAPGHFVIVLAFYGSFA